MQTVFVGLSGGVDSAVSAYLLKKQEYNVVGVFLKVWEPDFLPCTSGQDRLDAMRVAAHLEIPFLSYDLEEEYKKGVVDYFIAEYKAGRTPNPDVMCNREIKFGAFWDRAKKEGADFIATGHYAQIKPVNSDELSVKSGTRTITPGMFRGLDESKDQSYFLWTLTQDDLAHTLFPVGGLPKTEVRRIADEVELPNATKRDSQGLCFLGHVDMKEFLQHYIPVTKGIVRNKREESVGEHDGVQFYTIGQRLPIGSAEKMFVVGKNIEKNELIVSPSTATLAGQQFTLARINWIREPYPKLPSYEAQIRYHGERYEVSLKDDTLTFSTPVSTASGQSIVFYNKETGECLGGGVVV